MIIESEKPLKERLRSENKRGKKTRFPESVDGSKIIETLKKDQKVVGNIKCTSRSTAFIDLLDSNPPIHFLKYQTFNASSKPSDAVLIDLTYSLEKCRSVLNRILDIFETAEKDLKAQKERISLKKRQKRVSVALSTFVYKEKARQVVERLHDGETASRISLEPRLSKNQVYYIMEKRRREKRT